MKKTLLLQPKDFRQTLHFWLRRPDYGWAELWHGAPLTVEPFEERLELLGGPRPRWRILQTVKGMETSVYVDKDDLSARDFSVFQLPSHSWWRNEGQALLLDYLKFGTRNAPTAHALFSMLLLAGAFIYSVTKDGTGSLAFLNDEHIPHLSRSLSLLFVATPLCSLFINKILPTRTYLTTLFFKAEAWLLLFTALAALPQIPKGIKNFRAQVLAQAGQANQTSPAADDR